MSTNERFVLSDIKREQRKKSGAAVNIELDSEDQKTLNEFEEIVKKVRSYITQPKGFTEDEQKEYMRLLNRAVLGYKKEREQMFVRIKDVMSKENWDHITLPRGMDYTNIFEAVFANVIGLKVLEGLMSSSIWNQIEEIQVVDQDVFYVQRGDRLPKKYESGFPKLSDVKVLQENLVLYNEDSINEQKPWAEVITPTGLRIAMTRPPLTKEYSITIRNYTEDFFSFHRLIELKTINQKIATLLLAVLHGRLTTFITGDTGTGKTNMLLAFLSEMDERERFITIESDFELHVRERLPGRNVVQFQSLEELNLTPKQFFKIGLRMTPSRIIIPEVRDADAAEFIKAVSRGHKGSFSTGHILIVEDIPASLSSMAKQGDTNLDEKALEKRIAKFIIDIAIQLEFVGNERKVTRISEINLNSDGQVTVKDICRYDYEKKDWIFPHPIDINLVKVIKRNSKEAYLKLLNIGMVENAG